MTLVVDSTTGFAGFSYGAPETFTPSASPWIITNTNGFLVTAISIGGTVTSIEYQARTWADSGTWLLLPGLAGAVRLRPGDSVRITYILAPTVNWFPT